MYSKIFVEMEAQQEAMQLYRDTTGSELSRRFAYEMRMNRIDEPT